MFYLRFTMLHVYIFLGFVIYTQGVDTLEFEYIYLENISRKVSDIHH